MVILSQHQGSVARVGRTYQSYGSYRLLELGMPPANKVLQFTSELLYGVVW